MGNPRRASRAFGGTWMLVALLAVASPSSLAQPSSLADCDREAEEHPELADSFFCYYAVASRTGEWQAAAARLRDLLQRPHHPRALTVVAAIEEATGDPAAEATYAEAAAVAEEAGDVTGVIRSRLSRAFLLGELGRIEEADAEVAAARRALAGTTVPHLEASVLVGEASLAQRRSDYGRARSLYRQAEAIAFPDAPHFLQSDILSGLGYGAWAMGDYRSAIGYYRREAEMLQRLGYDHRASTPLYNIALVMGYLVGHRQASPEEAEQAAREALEVAARAGNPVAEASCRRLLGQSLGGEAGIAELERALQISRRLADPIGALQATRFIAAAYALMTEHRAEAEELARRAIAEARARGDLEQAAYGEILQAEVSYLFGARRDAIRRYLQAQDAVERIRDLQPERDVRAGVLSRYVHAYYRPAGYLLDGLGRGDTPDSDVELALVMMERMRARTLLDRMDLAGVSFAAAPESAALHDEREGILARIADEQRRLLEADLPDAERRAALERLESLEADEADLRDRIARADAGFAELRAPQLPGLSELQAALSPEEALLSYQLWYRPDPATRSTEDGGSWVVAVTRDSFSAFEIPGRDALEDRIAVFRGLFEGRDGSEERAARALYRDLLAEVLHWLPPEVTRLVIVPDSHLYHLPFAALRDDDSRLPLALRYGLSLSPSIATWMRWRDGHPTSHTRAAVLSLADPTPGGGVAAAWSGTGGMTGEGPLDRLPYARREARSFVTGVTGDLALGREASEARLKHADLSAYRVIHFAAHAVIDDAQPARSAVVLAPGSPDEDGLLQVREIVDLALDDPLVVLSTCRSASGKLMDGEGVVDLARAFFLAGARAVVGTHWPVRDDETAALMEAFAGGLGRGESVADALAEARRARILAGAPAIAWAGTVVIGDGDLVPAPHRTSAVPLPVWIAAGLTVILLATRRR